MHRTCRRSSTRQFSCRLHMCLRPTTGHSRSSASKDRPVGRNCRNQLAGSSRSHPTIPITRRVPIGVPTDRFQPAVLVVPRPFPMTLPIFDEPLTRLIAIGIEFLMRPVKLYCFAGGVMNPPKSPSARNHEASAAAFCAISMLLSGLRVEPEDA
jgi:hypothetical protein